MGLDMYLNGHLDLWDISDEKKAIIINNFSEIDRHEPKSIIIEVGYWRKANHIHNWFVENVQEGTDDCKEYYVSREDLEELKSVCEQILVDRTKAAELLSTKSGFFFGGTDYDQYYFDDLSKTIEIINKALAMNGSIEFYYRSSW